MHLTAESKNGTISKIFAGFKKVTKDYSNSGAAKKIIIDSNAKQYTNPQETKAPANIFKYNPNNGIAHHQSGNKLREQIHIG